MSYEPRQSRRRKWIVPASGLALVIFVVAWILSHLGGSGIGIGAGTAVENSGTAVTEPPATQRAEPLEVVVHEDRYLVEGNEMTGAQIVLACGRPAPGRVAVKIVSGPDARLGAERALQDTLDRAQLPWAIETAPGGQ